MSCWTTPVLQRLLADDGAAAAALLYMAVDSPIARHLHGTGDDILGHMRRTVGRAHVLLLSAPRVLVLPD